MYNCQNRTGHITVLGETHRKGKETMEKEKTLNESKNNQTPDSVGVVSSSLLSASLDLLGYVRAMRKTNTSEYMEDLIIYINNLQEILDLQARFKYDKKGYIVRDR